MVKKKKWMKLFTQTKIIRIACKEFVEIDDENKGSLLQIYSYQQKKIADRMHCNRLW
jgi:hypothetical protein